MRFTVDCRTWLRGGCDSHGRYQDSALGVYVPIGPAESDEWQGCCAGHYCAALAIPLSSFIMTGEVSALLDPNDQYETQPLAHAIDQLTADHTVKWRVTPNPGEYDDPDGQPIIHTIYVVNDDPHITDDERKWRLFVLWQLLGHYIVFIN